MDGMDMNNMGMDTLGDLEAMFGGSNEAMDEREKIVLTQNLEGFASCFPEWDLHPPKF